MSLKGFVYRVVGSGFPLLARFGPHFAMDAVGIIMVHGVHEGSVQKGLPPPRSSVSVEALEKNLLGLRPLYSFVSMEEILAMVGGKAPFQKRCLALTFDDSLKCHAELVAPRLARWGIPATFFLSTETIQTQRPYWWLRLEHALALAGKGWRISMEIPGHGVLSVDSTQGDAARRRMTSTLRCSGPADHCEEMVDRIETQLGVTTAGRAADYPYAAPLTWDGARDIAKRGFTIGSHTVTHPNLSLLDESALRSEFVQSRERIEQEIQMPCRHLCYPHGYYSDAVCKAAEAAGYLSAVTVDAPGWNKAGANAHRLGRFGMPGQPYKLPFMLTGAADLLGNLRQTWRGGSRKVDAAANGTSM